MWYIGSGRTCLAWRDSLSEGVPHSLQQLPLEGREIFLVWDSKMFSYVETGKNEVMATS